MVVVVSGELLLEGLPFVDRMMMSGHPSRGPSTFALRDVMQTSDLSYFRPCRGDPGD